MNATSTQPVVALQDASVHFGSARGGFAALQALSLSIAPGERVALIGANGCGKSTLLRLLHGLIAPSHGHVVRDPARPWAMVFQRPFLMRLPVLANVMLGLWLRGQSWSDAKERAQQALAQVGLADQGARPARKLSGGQQQRVALARAWALKPQVLLLDEPTSSLDPHAKREVEALVTRFAATDPSVTLVFASHNLGQVKRLASRVIYLEQGRVLADLPVNDFFDRDLQRSHPEAHAFIKGETA